MVQSDPQLKAFLRFLIDALEDAISEQNEEKKVAKIKRIIYNLQRSLEN